MTVWHWAMSAVVSAIAGFAVGWSAVIVFGGLCMMLLLKILVVFLSTDLGEEIP